MKLRLCQGQQFFLSLGIPDGYSPEDASGLIVVRDKGSGEEIDVDSLEVEKVGENRFKCVFTVVCEFVDADGRVVEDRYARQEAFFDYPG